MKVKDLRDEVWKPIRLPAAHKSKRYYVSNKSRIKSVDKKTKSEFLKSAQPDRHGHLVTGMHLENGKKFSCWVHKEVAKRFVEKPSRKHELVVHKNFKRDDNSLRNLKWVTKEEHKSYIKSRLKNMGWEHPRIVTSSKLTRRKVANLKKKLLNLQTTKKKLANEYGISVTQLNRIASGENWADVPPAK